MPPNAGATGAAGFLQGFNSVVGPYIERQAYSNQQSQASQVIMLKKQAQKRLEEIDNAGQMDQFKQDPNFQALVQFAYGVDAKAPGKEVLTFLASPGPSTEEKISHGLESAKKAAGIGGAPSTAPTAAGVLGAATPQGTGPAPTTPTATATENAQYGPPSFTVTSKGNASVSLSPLSPTELSKKEEEKFKNQMLDEITALSGQGVGLDQAIQQARVAVLQRPEWKGKVPASEIGALEKRASAGPIAGERAAASTAGRLGVEGSPFGLMVKRNQAAASAAGSIDAKLDRPMNPNDAIAAEAQDRGISGATRSQFMHEQRLLMKVDEAGATANERAQVKERYARLPESTQKTLNDIGIVRSVVGRIKAALADPELGPEIVASRGVLKGRLLDQARKYGLSQGEAKDLYGTLLAQANIIAVQPYLRGVRRYEFIQDARQHIPQPGDELPLVMTKLDEIEKLTNGYENLAFFYARPAAQIKQDIARGVDPAAGEQAPQQVQQPVVAAPAPAVPAASAPKTAEEFLQKFQPTPNP